ncbi:MAG: hypothetical protein IID40_06335 [Planctomycetes bacterium]|nr:hypothetical protein [Planctomycetota bacterium]
MIIARLAKCAALVVLLWAPAAGSRAFGLEGGAKDEPLTKVEFARFLEEYRQFKAQTSELRDQNEKLRSELAEVRIELTTVQQQQRRVQMSQEAAAEERSDMLHRIQNELDGGLSSLLPGTNNLMITGFAAATFMNREESDSTFSGVLAPVILWKATDELFFEAELHFMLGEDETHVDLGYAQISYLLNDYVTVAGGKFLLPFGTFPERLHPPWINKLPTAPLTANLVGESGLGFQLRGGAPIGPTKINYTGYVINGPDFGESLTNAGRLGFDRNLDNNNNKAIGARIGFLPIPEMEIGYSFLTGRVGNSGFDNSGVDTVMHGVDFTYARQFEALEGRLEFRGEAVWVDTDDVIFTGPFDPFTYDNKRSGWYIQAAYRPTLSDFKLGDKFDLKNLEFIVRYDQLRQPGPDRLGLDRDQLTFGLDYWVLPNAVLKAAFVLDDAHGGEDQNGFFMQMAVGF